MAKEDYFQEADDEITFNIINRDVVDRLRRDGDIVLPEKKISVSKDERWNTKQMTSKVLKGLENGDSVQSVAKSLQEVIGNNSNSAIRNARTMVTSAENHGRLDSYKNLSNQGVVMKKEWQATPDDRTRPSHIDIDGEEQDIDKVFSNGCQFPGDARGPAEEVWMCRCAMGTHIIGFKRADGTVSEVNYQRDETLHDQQMAAEKARRSIESGSKQKTSAYDVLGTPPQRPKSSDYGGYTDEFYAARDAYRQERKEYEARVEKWYDENVNTNAMSIDELQKWCENNGCVIYGSLDGLDGVSLRNYTERYEQLSKDFPIVSEYHNRTGRPFEIAYDPKASFDAEASHGMTFGHAFSDYRDFVKDQAYYGNGVDFVMGESPAVRTFDHEFGHQVYDAMKYGRDKEIWNSTREETQRRIDMERDLMTNVNGKKGMSDYATTNADELFAEAFSAWYGGEKTEFANAFGEFLGRWMK